VDRGLSALAATQIDVPSLAELPSGKSLQYTRMLRRDELELWASPLVKRLATPVKEAMRRCARKREEIEEVLLVGGSTRIPAVRKELAVISGREPSTIANPEEVVAVGAALEVARLDGAIEGVLLIDVAARGLMISRQGQDCEPVIAQSAVVPTRELRLLPTRHDDQVRVEFDLWEGESPDPAVNRHLGRYAVVDLPEAPAGDVLVLVEVTLDTDGVIRLGASEMVSGDRVTIEQIYHAGLPRSEVARIAKQLAGGT
jgi:molecular chaperone DnaK